MSSDDDQPIVEDLSIGYSDTLELVVRIEHTDYEEDDRCSLEAVVTKDDAFELSKRLGVGMQNLPGKIAEEFDSYDKIINARFSDVHECFKGILNYLSALHTRYRIIEHPDRTGYVCRY